MVVSRTSASRSASVMASSKESQEDIVDDMNSRITSPSINSAALPSSPPSSPLMEERSSNTRRGFSDKLSSPGKLSSDIITHPPTSPQNPSNIIHIDKKIAQDRTWIDAPALTHVLLPNKWRCGAIKNDKTPCKGWTPVVNRRNIDTRIHAMIGFTQSSPELRTQLQELVMLVHCKFHDFDKYNATRIEAWRLQFPGGEEKRLLVESIEKQIKRALGTFSAKCVWGEGLEQPCSKGIGGQKVQNCMRTIDKIVHYADHRDETYIEGFLKVLLANMYCSNHVNDRAFEQVAKWKRKITGIREDGIGKLVQHIEITSIEGSGLDSGYWTDNIVLRNRSPPALASSRSTCLDFTMDPTEFWPTAYDITPFRAEPSINRCVDYRASYKLVEKEIKRNLEPEALKGGHVYLYEVDGNPGLVKIGYTCRTIQERLEEWTFDCNRETKLLYPIPSGSVMAIPSARRVEALCHAELDHCRTRALCSGCLKPHIEWFEISAEEAIKVVKKWTKWMTTCPYDIQKQISGNIGTLKKEELQKLCNIGQFIEDL